MTESCIGLLDIFTNLSPIRSKRAHYSRGRWSRLFLIGTLSAGATSFAIAENPEMAMDKMTDEELRAFRDQKIIALRAHRRQFHPEETAEGTMHSRIFFCTIYYTPRNRASRPSAGLMPHPLPPRDYTAANTRAIFCWR